jgi:hypothetical protein
MKMIAVPASNSLQRFENLRLNGHIEGCRWLVGDQDFWVVRNRHRNDDALTHPAREFVGVRVEPVIRVGNANETEKINRLGTRFVLFHVAVGPDRLDQLPTNGVHGVQRGHRVLEDHCDSLPADFAHLTGETPDDLVVADLH